MSNDGLDMESLIRDGYANSDGTPTEKTTKVLSAFEVESNVLIKILEAVQPNDGSRPVEWHNNAANYVMEAFLQETAREIVIMAMIGNLDGILGMMQLFFVVGYEAGEGEIDLTKCQCDVTGEPTIPTEKKGPTPL